MALLQQSQKNCKRDSRSARVFAGIFIIVMLFSVMPVFTHAQAAGSSGDPACEITDYSKAIRVSIPIPLITQPQVTEGKTYYYIKDMGCYIAGIYRYLAGVAGILAAVMAMYGGLRYIMSYGNPQRVSAAKDQIVSALIGLALVLGSYVILNFINPKLTEMNLQSFDKFRTVYQNDIWCEDNAGSKPAEAGKSVADMKCGDKGVTPKNEECVWKGSDCYPQNKVCWTGPRAIKYGCYPAEMACLGTESSSFAGVPLGIECNWIDDQVQLTPIGKEKRCKLPLVSNPGGGVGCAFMDILTCESAWEQVDCNFGPSSQCWDTLNNKPRSQGKLECQNYRRAALKDDSICCTEKQDVDCRDKGDCNSDEVELPSCTFNGEVYTRGFGGSNNDSCTQAELNAGQVCCMQLKLWNGVF